MARLLMFVFVLAPFCSSGIAATEKTALSGDPVAAVNFDLAMVSKGSSPKTKAMMAIASDPQFIAMTKTLAAHKLELLPHGQSLCLSDRVATLCWHPVIAGVKTGVQFEGSNRPFFYKATWNQDQFRDELRKFLHQNRRKGAFSLLRMFNLFFPEARADDSPVGKLSEPADIRTLPYDAKTSIWTRYLADFPYTIVYWNGKAWAQLADNPEDEQINAFAKGAREELAGWLGGEKGDTYSCGNQEFSWTRKSDGKRVTLTKFKAHAGLFRFSVTNDAGKQVPIANLGLHVGPEAYGGNWSDEGCKEAAKNGVIYDLQPFSCPNQPEETLNGWYDQNSFYRRKSEADTFAFCAWSKMVCSYPAPLRPVVVKPCLDSVCGDVDYDGSSFIHNYTNINGQGDIYQAVVGGAAAKKNADVMQHSRDLHADWVKKSDAAVALHQQLDAKLGGDSPHESGTELSGEAKTVADADAAVKEAKAAYENFSNSDEWPKANNSLENDFLQSLGKMQEKMIVYTEVERCCESQPCIEEVLKQSGVRLIPLHGSTDPQDAPSLNLPGNEDAR
jgi:hypothetical protein